MEWNDSYEKMINGLPKALSEEEQKKYMDLYYRNADKNSEDAKYARGKLIESNLRLVVTVVNKYFAFSRTPKDEMYSCGVEWMVNAIDNFDIEKGYALSTYLVPSIKNGIIRDYVVTNRHLVQTLSLDAPISNEFEEDACSFQDLIPDPDNFVEQSDRKMSSEVFMKKLDSALHKKYPEYKVDMLYRHVGIMGYEKQTLDSIGKLYDMTRERVRQIITKEFSFIKKELLGEKNKERSPQKESNDKTL